MCVETLIYIMKSERNEREKSVHNEHIRLSVRAYGAHYHHLPFKLDIGTILSRTSHSQVECNKHF